MIPVTQHQNVEKKDPNYEISRKVITDPRAEKLLLEVIKNSVVFKNPQDYRLCRDTYYVESFNDVVNVYQDKRISFSDEQYNARANLAVCHWNENVDREFTSLQNATQFKRKEKSQEMHL